MAQASVGAQFEGQVALITGASRGIGLAAAEALVARGAKVVITGRDADALAAAVKDLGGPGTALGVAGKADDPEHAAAAVAATIAEFGRLDHLVANAGINPVYGPILDASPASIRKVLEVNVFSVLEWLRLARDAWMGANGGSVVTMASITGMGASSGIGVYGVSKAALIALTEQLAVELAPAIRVNAVAPGVVKTKFAAALYAEGEDIAAAPYPMKRLGVPADIGSAVAFLLSEEASWITGHTLVVDGGVTKPLGGMEE